MNCEWCGCDTSKQCEVFVGNVVYNRDGIIQFFHLGRFINVPAIISSMESGASKSGRELVFVVCSMDCGDRLMAAHCNDSTLRWPSSKAVPRRRRCHRRNK